MRLTRTILSYSCILAVVTNIQAQATTAPDYTGFVAGYAFLDQGNAHGGVLVGYTSSNTPFELTPQNCRAACTSNPQCGGVTFNPDTPTCLLNKAGSAYYARSIAHDFAWVKPADYTGFVAGYAFLDQGNAHGGVLVGYGSESTTFELTPQNCRAACASNPQCGGVTFNPDTPTCLLNKPGTAYFGQGLAGDYAWVKPIA